VKTRCGRRAFAGKAPGVIIRGVRRASVIWLCTACSFEPGAFIEIDAAIDSETLAPTSCQETDAQGITTIELAGQLERVFCQQTVDGGGWTLIGSFINNDGARTWNTAASLQDATTFGSLDSHLTADYKATAYGSLPGRSILVVTEEYAFAFHDLFASQTFATFATSMWPTTCSTAWLREGPSFTQGLTTEQANALGIIVLPLDTNDGDCFPNGQAAAIAFLSGPLHNNGLGNSTQQPIGGEAWAGLDMSLPNLASFTVSPCAGTYPCNTNGLTKTWDDYGEFVKAQRALLFIR
jgi:hypothetical protein